MGGRSYRSKPVKRTIILLTDGTPTNRWDSTWTFGTGCSNETEWGDNGYDKDQKLFHCTRFWAQQSAMAGITIIYIQIPFGGGSSSATPASPTEMRDLLLANAAPLPHDDTGIQGADADNYLQLLATNYDTILDE